MKKSLKPLHAPPPKLSSPMKTAMRTASHAIALGALLVSGAVWTISQQHPLYANPGRLLRLPAAVVDASQPTEEAFRIGEVLNQYTHDRALAFRIADAIVDQAKKENLDPALLVGVLLTEDATLDPRARSSVGARGLMQVMPLHSGKWGCGSKDLFDVEVNICHGVQILKAAIDGAPNTRVALLRYNGCVRGRNTPNCHTYDDKVLRHAGRAAAEMRLVKTQKTD
ncbi:MAG TPA: lytic transglycosylase domain-containing protein [Gemmatimonadaceae bacterium]|nr:lytic transglycosylase domain-containing protein [Gemmatimonadaceae bacterium]